MSSSRPTLQHPPVSPTGARPRFLSEADCHDIAQRLVRYARGGGDTTVAIVSRWTGNVRWARNLVDTTGEDRNNHLNVYRQVGGANSYDAVVLNEVSDDALMAATRRAERLIGFDVERVETDLIRNPHSPFHVYDEPFPMPQLFFDATYQLNAEQRAEAARHLAQLAAEAGMLSAGYIEVSATSYATLNSWGYARYYQYTWAQCSMTVRDPKGNGSGWAGVDWPDWTKVDGDRLAAIALDKCLRSRNPVAIEPGRYTTILESQAVCNFMDSIPSYFGREGNERFPDAPFHKSGASEPPTDFPIGYSRMGEQVIDERISISADPMDPELGFPPYEVTALPDVHFDIYHPAVWIEHGVLKMESYNRNYAVTELGRDTGLPDSGAFRMSGGDTSIEEMIATTKRGLLVTRFDQVLGPFDAALLCRGYTRDGLWLIENGKISKAVKNMVFVESILFALNNVEQLGPPQRVFHAPRGGAASTWFRNPRPVIVPPLKIRDFSFTALSDAI